MPAALNLVVLRVRDLDRTLAFYTALGLEFQRERHASGPEHWSAQAGSVLLELYPAMEGEQPTSGRLGFAVDSIEETAKRLRELGVPCEAKPSKWGLRAVVEDPEGRRVEVVSN